MSKTYKGVIEDMVLRQAKLKDFEFYEKLFPFQWIYDDKEKVEHSEEKTQEIASEEEEESIIEVTEVQDGPVEEIEKVVKKQTNSSKGKSTSSSSSSKTKDKRKKKK